MSMLELEKRSILVVGDMMLDRYYIGAVDRISPEAPVPVFRKTHERSVAGGAANVATNLVAAGQDVSLLSAIGDDESGSKLIDILSKSDIDCSLVVKSSKPTITKTRFLAENNQQVLRLDEEDSRDIDDSEWHAVIQKLEGQIKKFKAVVISDYLKGFLTPALTQAVINLARKNNIKVFADIKDPILSKYKGTDLIKPNLNELIALSGMNVTSQEDLVAAAEKLLRECDTQYVLCTQGAKGMTLVSRDHEPVFISAVGKEVFDVTGAGDTVIAYLVACFVNGYSLLEAMRIANIASGIQISKVGTSCVYPDEVQTAMNDLMMAKQAERRYISREQIPLIRKCYRNKKIVFTNGCFDILHVGHMRYLRQAAQLGDLLIVGVNTDASVRRIKGNSRPINALQDRVEMLSALDFVDYVVVFDEETPFEVIKELQPDVLVKGGDYSIDQIVGKDLVRSHGGEVVVLPLVAEKSSTNIINKILESHGEE